MNTIKVPISLFDVTFFQIVTPDYKVLSPKFKTYKQAFEAMSNVVDLSARISEQTLIYDCINDDGRKELLAELQA